jgi:hypothetical protein
MYTYDVYPTTATKPIVGGGGGGGGGLLDGCLHTRCFQFDGPLMPSECTIRSLLTATQCTLLAWVGSDAMPHAREKQERKREGGRVTWPVVPASTKSKQRAVFEAGDGAVVGVDDGACPSTLAARTTANTPITQDDAMLLKFIFPLSSSHKRGKCTHDAGDRSPGV